MIDWKIIALILQFFTTIVTVVIFCVIKFNDLKHLTTNVRMISGNIDKIYRKLNKLEKSIIKRESICEERHKK